MPVTEIGDPRLQALFGASDPRDAGARPTIRLPRKGLPAAALVAIALLLGLALFMVLNVRRTSQAEPSVKLRPDSGAAAWEAPPSLSRSSGDSVASMRATSAANSSAP